MKLSDRCRAEARLLDRQVWVRLPLTYPNPDDHPVYNREAADLRDLLLDTADQLDKHPVL